MTEKIFYKDAYIKTCESKVTQVNELGVQLDRSIFYPVGGGQPGDTGLLRNESGFEVIVSDTVPGVGSEGCLHLTSGDPSPLVVGDIVTAELNWNNRYLHMRMHSALHLLCSVIDGGVTGGSVGAEKGRLDFDLPDTNLDKEEIEKKINRLVEEDHNINSRWITEEELDSNVDLIRTMSVKPPREGGQVRLVEIEGVDLQACGGTHVGSSREIGKLRIGKIENKGRHNRRVNLHFAD